MHWEPERRLLTPGRQPGRGQYLTTFPRPLGAPQSPVPLGRPCAPAREPQVLMLTTTPSQVYAMLLSSFLWFAIRSGGSLDRKGKYTLSQR